ncbi:MAG: TraR/DksA family transcriptional regulator [Pseudomonadota bacterium]
MSDPRTLLEARLTALDVEDAAGRDGQKVVELDQQAVGRLSRMDALQSQAMAQATARRRQVERARIHAALKRLEEGEYGYCTDCSDAVETARLAADPTLPLCAECMSER